MLSVAAVMLVPLIVTVAPARGLPDSSVTFPLTVLSWAWVLSRLSASRSRSRHFFIQAMFVFYFGDKPRAATSRLQKNAGGINKAFNNYLTKSLMSEDF